MILDVILVDYSVDAPVVSAIDVVLGAGGPSGPAAKQSVGFAWVGPFDAGEPLGGAALPGSATFVPADCFAYVDTAPTSDATFTITRNASPWAAVVIAAGETQGAVTIANPTVVDGDLLRITAPTSVDPTLSGLYVTLASAG